MLLKKGTKVRSTSITTRGTYLLGTINESWCTESGGEIYIVDWDNGSGNICERKDIEEV